MHKPGVFDRKTVRRLRELFSHEVQSQCGRYGNEMVHCHRCVCFHIGLLPISRAESEIDVVSAQLCLLDGVCTGAFPHVSGC